MDEILIEFNKIRTHPAGYSKQLYRYFQDINIH